MANSNAKQPTKRQTKSRDTARRRMFVLHFCSNGGNATQAAKDAGFSMKTAYSIGHKLKNDPEVKALIEKKLEEMSLTPNETLKGISDIARSSLNDYLIEKEIIRTPRKVVPLSEVLKTEREKVEDLRTFAHRAQLTGKELDRHNAEVLEVEKGIIRMEIELERNPAAVRVIDLAPETVTVVDLDLKKLKEDKERGRIKVLKHTEFGIHVELYGADAALRDMGKVHGLFEKDNKQKTPENAVPFMTDQQFTTFFKTAVHGAAKPTDPPGAGK